jgi:hypothetical protein
MSRKGRKQTIEIAGFGNPVGAGFGRLLKLPNQYQSSQDRDRAVND